MLGEDPRRARRVVAGREAKPDDRPRRGDDLVRGLDDPGCLEREHVDRRPGEGPIGDRTRPDQLHARKDRGLLSELLLGHGPSRPDELP